MRFSSPRPVPQNNEATSAGSRSTMERARPGPSTRTWPSPFASADEAVTSTRPATLHAISRLLMCISQTRRTAGPPGSRALWLVTDGQVDLAEVVEHGREPFGEDLAAPAPEHLPQLVAQHLAEEPSYRGDLAAGDPVLAR